MADWIKQLAENSPLFGLCLLPLALGLVFGVSYTQARAASSLQARRWLGSKPLAWIITVGGAYALSIWNVKDAGPVSGFFFVAAVALSWFISSELTVRACRGGIADLSAEERQRINGFIRSNLYELGQQATHETAQAEINKCREKADKKTGKVLRAAIKELHDFIHEARDGAAEYVREYGEAVAKFRDDRDGYIGANAKRRSDYLKRVLQELLEVFKPTVGDGCPLWLAIRVVDTVGDCDVYRTVARVGGYDKGRTEKSVDLAVDGLFPRHIIEQHRRGRGIVVLGSRKPTTVWAASSNDVFQEDVSVMAGPIFLKNQKPALMAMILYVNSPHADVFRDLHVDLMKCCVDVLSMFFTMMAELAAAREDGLEARVAENLKQLPKLAK
jgi:hypothetical protein